MDFELSEQQMALINDVDEFCRELNVDSNMVNLLEKGGPDADELERKLDQKLVKNGWYGLPFPEQYGGMGKGAFELGLFIEAFHRGGLPYPGRIVTTLFLGLHVLHNGSEEQKNEIIPKIVRGETTLSISVTEPGAGSDINAMKTKAVEDGDGFSISGQKVYSSGAAGENNIIVLAARTDSKKHVRDCLTLFLVPSNSKGIEFRKLDSLGRRIGGLYEVFLDDVWVSKRNVLGEVNQGWKVLMSNFNVERAVAAASNLGYTERIFNEVLHVARTKMCNGQQIGTYESVAQEIAEYAIEIEASRLLVYRAFCTIEEGKRAVEEVSVSKLYATELLKRLGDFAMGLSGASAYRKDSVLQWYFRESRIGTIGGGSSQIMRNLAGTTLGLKAS